MTQNPKILYMHAEKYLNCLSAESAIASRRWKFLEKITVSENKLCCIFAVNATKNFLRYDKRDGSTQQYNDIILNRIISLVV